MPDNDPRQQVREAIDGLRQLRNGVAASAKQLDGLTIPGELREQLKAHMLAADSGAMLALTRLMENYQDQK